MMSSFCAPAGLVPALEVAMGRTMPLGAAGPLSQRAVLRAGGENRRVAVVRIDRVVAEFQGVGIEQQLVRVEAVAGRIDIATKPVADPLVQAGSYGQFGPQAR